MSAIGSLNESPLHAAIKRIAAPAGSVLEAKVGPYLIDAATDDLLVEVQTRNLGAIRTKLGALLPTHRVRLVLPVAARKWLVKHHPCGRIERRRSPKRRGAEELFAELVYAPTLPAHPNFELELYLIEEEEHRRLEPGRARRRRGWIVTERRLLEVRERRLYGEATELLALLPGGLPDPFTTADLARLGGWPRRLAQQAAYTLHALELVKRDGKVGNAHLYRFPAAH